MSTSPRTKEDLENELNSFQFNSLVTLADLALNCSNNDRDHCYSVVDSKKSLSGVLNKECLIQKEKDHTYAFSGRTKSTFHKQIPKQIHRRSSSEENVSRNCNINKEVVSSEQHWGIYNKKSQSYEEILQPNDASCQQTDRQYALILPTVPNNVQEGSSMKQLKITDDIFVASRKLLRKDHTYAVARPNAAPSGESLDIDMVCEVKRKLSPLSSTSFNMNHDHLYNKLNEKSDKSSSSLKTLHMIKKTDIPSWSRKNDHSYFTFHQNIQDEKQSIDKTKMDDVIQHSSKGDRPVVKSDHTYFSLA